MWIAELVFIGIHFEDTKWIKTTAIKFLGEKGVEPLTREANHIPGAHMVTAYLSKAAAIERKGRPEHGIGPDAH